ncbi:MAG: sulfatase-like hydrolase/transferase [Gemmatimonadota bacterium]|nr:MAG: sulfatase-like hydrolase/transferase [Gemmatimonadota bacterium]
MSLVVFGSSSCDRRPAALTADLPLHLEARLDNARVEGSAVPGDVPEPVTWDFAEPQPDWRVLEPWEPEETRTEVSRTEDALRITLGDVDVTDEDDDTAVGGIYIDVPDWKRDEWAYVQVRARSDADVDWMGFILGFNLRDKSEVEEGAEDEDLPFEYYGETATVIRDGTIQTYNLRADWSGGRWEGPWKQMVLGFWAEKEASIELLSVTVIPKEATYAGQPYGVHSEVRNRVYRRALYTHTPGRVQYRIRVPDAGRLDLGLGVLREDVPVTFRISAASAGAEPELLLEETYADEENWGQRSIDLSHMAGQTVDLALETESQRSGTVALWAAPTLTGSAVTNRPNVIFYVIDGGAADYMSVYGYNRRTTPYLERLAAEGALFEWAYSNSSWTKPSTASFMTSLQNSVMGGQTNWTDPVPDQIRTMAEHMHDAGYETAVLVANPNAGTLSNLQRGVDVMKESWEEFTYFGRENHKQSSRFMHDRFWTWREAYPGTPYWVHFQTTDVHRPQDLPAGANFSGLFASPDQRRVWITWHDSLTAAEEGRGPYADAWEKTGLDRVAFYTVWQALYDESMAHNDYQIGQLVERLKAEGEWENTLLIIAADHSVRSAGSDQGLALQDSLPPRWNRPILRPTISRVPLMFIWPGHIEGGQRYSQPVSMLDVLPTLLDLIGLPMPEIMMGQSLAPLLLGREDREPRRPVILDEFWVDQETGELRGRLEVIDGRWGASLEINPRPPDEDEDEEDALWRRPVPLLLYDRWNDHFCLNSVHEQHPELVAHYTEFLERQWAAHQALAQHFTQSGDAVLNPEQLETLRSLGYIQ